MAGDQAESSEGYSPGSRSTYQDTLRRPNASNCSEDLIPTKRQRRREAIRNRRYPGRGKGRGPSPLARSVSLEQREKEWELRFAEAEKSIASLTKERDQEASSRRALEKEVENLREKLNEMEARALARDEEATNMSSELQRAREKAVVMEHSLRKRVLLTIEEKGELQEALCTASDLERELEKEIRRTVRTDVKCVKLQQKLDTAKANMKATQEKYRSRSREIKNIQLQNEHLDELNSKYLDQMMKLDVKIADFEDKIEQYKNQAVELERQNFEVTSALALKDAEIQRLRKELETATQASRSRDRFILDPESAGTVEEDQPCGPPVAIAER